MATVYYPRWLLLEDGSLLENGALSVEGSRIAAVGSRRDVRRGHGDRAVNLSNTLLLPGLINLHTHLEEGVFRGFGSPQEETFVAHRAKRETRLTHADPAAVASSVRLGARELLTNGVTSVLDTSRLGVSARVLEEEPIRAWVHHEVHPGRKEREDDALDALAQRIGDTPGGVHSSTGPHALYSLAPPAHRRTIALSREIGCPWASHIAESAEEVQAFSEQSGDLFFQITRRGPWPFGTNPTGPMYYAITNNLIPNGAICYHCNYVTGNDLVLLAAKSVSVVVCPSYTAQMGHKPFPVDLALKRGIRLCVGTESVADASSMNLFDELYCLRELHPHIPAAAILQWATRNPAQALGRGRELGVLVPGARADLLGVAVPHDPRMDVLEELLVEEPVVKLVVVDGEEVIADS